MKRNGGDIECFDRVVFKFDDLWKEIADYYKQKSGVLL